jgi:hypothetical protein
MCNDHISSNSSHEEKSASLCKNVRAHQKCEMASSVNREDDRFKAPPNYIREFLQVITYYGRSSVIILVLGRNTSRPIQQDDVLSDGNGFQ